MKNKVKQINPIVISILLSLGLCCFASSVTNADTYPDKERLSVLIIGTPYLLGVDFQGKNLAEKTVMEALGNIRFTSTPVPYPGGSRALDIDGIFGKSKQLLALRKHEIIRLLKKKFAAVIFSPGNLPTYIDADIQNALADMVENGGVLIWMGGKLEKRKKSMGYPCAIKRLQNLLPFQGTGQIKEYRGVDPLKGLALGIGGLEVKPGRKILHQDKAGNDFFILHTLSYYVTKWKRGKPHKIETQVPFAFYRRFNKGAVLALQTGDSLFPEYVNKNVDGELYWAKAYERLIKFAEKGFIKPAINIQASINDTTLSEKPTFTLKLMNLESATVKLEQSDMHGVIKILKESIKLKKDVETNIQGVASTFLWQEIRAISLNDKFADGRLFVKLSPPINLKLHTLKQGIAPTYNTLVNLSINAKTNINRVKLSWEVVDWANLPVFYTEEITNLKKNEALKKDFTFKLKDKDARAWVYWVRAVITDLKNNILAQKETQVYRYRPYKTDEQILLSTWHTDAATRLRPLSDIFLKYLRKMGFNSVKGTHDFATVERNNFRIYEEFGRSTTYGQDRRTAPFNAKIKGYQKRYQTQGEREVVSGRFSATSKDNKKKWQTAALNMYSMGEETGYGMWSAAYPWRNKKEAPEKCNKWFRFFLQKKYKSIQKLNSTWEKNFKDWSDIKVWRKYAEPFGWLYFPPPKELDKNLAPYIDTHSFHEWYITEYVQNYIKGFKQNAPVPTWTMSYDFTFIQKSPSPLTQIYYAIPPENVANWHAYIRSRTPGINNPFSMNWGFFEDEAMNNQFYKMSYALGCTYISSWGHVFNTDLTPTRPAMTAAKTRKEMKPIESILLKMKPRYNQKIGIYTYDSPWGMVRGRYGYYLHRYGPNDLNMGPGPTAMPGVAFLKPPEVPLYSALTASGYSPKYVTEDEFAECKILFLPYVEAIEKKTAEKLSRYVKNGGILVAFPVLAEYDGNGKPYKTYPGAGLDRLFGFQAVRKWKMGRYPVEFPGENIAKKLFSNAWERTTGVKKQNKKEVKQNTPLFFNFSKRIGMHPNNYLPEGHEIFTKLNSNTIVVGRHEDGEPLVTYKKHGAGVAICMNILLTTGNGLDRGKTTEQTETFRQIIDQLVRRFNLKPDFEFKNARFYDEGISEFATTQYNLPGTQTRILTLFSDWRHRRSDTRLLLNDNFTQVWDLIAGKPLPLIKGIKSGLPEAFVSVAPGNWRVLALTKKYQEKPNLISPKKAQLGQAFKIKIISDKILKYYGRLSVSNDKEFKKTLIHHERNITLNNGESITISPRLNEPIGTWYIRFTDAVTRKISECKVNIKNSDATRRYKKGVKFYQANWKSETLMKKGPKISDTEFMALLDRLGKIHLSEVAVDKRKYSYYTYEVENSRQRTNQLLACVDWQKRLPILTKHLKCGNTLYLVGEDMGYEPKTGISTTTVRNPRILKSLDNMITKYKAKIFRVPHKPYLRILKVGKGMVVLDRRSPDASGNSNLQLATFHIKWIKEIQRLELTPSGTHTESLQQITKEANVIEKWFFTNK